MPQSSIGPGDVSIYPPPSPPIDCRPLGIALVRHEKLPGRNGRISASGPPVLSKLSVFVALSLGGLAHLPPIVHHDHWYCARWYFHQLLPVQVLLPISVVQSLSGKFLLLDLQLYLGGWTSLVGVDYWQHDKASKKYSSSVGNNHILVYLFKVVIRASPHVYCSVVVLIVSWDTFVWISKVLLYCYNTCELYCN